MSKSLEIFIGIPGCGKNAYAAAKQEANSVLDVKYIELDVTKYRSQMFELNDYAHEPQVIEAMLKDASKYASEAGDSNLIVAFNACNLRYSDRFKITQMAIQSGFDKVQYVLFNQSLKIDECQFRIRDDLQNGRFRANTRYNDMVKKNDQYINLISKIMKSGYSIPEYFKDELKIPDSVDVGVTVLDSASKVELELESA
jgi:predicted kinase